MKKLLVFAMILAQLLGFASAAWAQSVKKLTNADILIRDTYIVPYNGKYYMYGTDGMQAAGHFYCYVGTDLKNWEGPYTVYQNDGSNWATQKYWAPEVYNIGSSFYFICGWSSATVKDQTLQVLKADNPLGPFGIYSGPLVTGNDATLYKEDGKTYIIATHTGAKGNGFYAFQISEDLKTIIGNPDGMFLFDYKGCAWAKTLNDPENNIVTDRYLLDGACTYVTKSGKLLIMWSSWSDVKYNVGIAYSDNGKLSGKWKHEDNYLLQGNTGHNSLFYTFDGKLMSAAHYPNSPFGKERPIFVELAEDRVKDTLKIADSGTKKLSNAEINIRDTFVVVYQGKYYMYGTRGDSAFSPSMDGYDVYVSTDLRNWEGPYEVYHNNGDNWATRRYWAPEVYAIDGTFYMFTAWADSKSRQTPTILTANNPLGPFKVYSGPFIRGNEGNDLTLYVENRTNYIVLNHECTVHKNGMYYWPMNHDFSGFTDEPKLMFTSEGCSWCTQQPARYHDGAFMYRMSTGTLLTLFSNQSAKGYAVGIVKSDNGRLDGKWTHQDELLITGGGHGMFFTSLEGKMLMAVHMEGEARKNFAHFYEMKEDLANDTLVIVKGSEIF
jgi:GH43 family beta-xylosidase